MALAEEGWAGRPVYRPPDPLEQANGLQPLQTVPALTPPTLVYGESSVALSACQRFIVSVGRLHRMFRPSHCGVHNHSSSPPSRHLPRPERTCKHPGVRTRLAMEHQARHRGQLDARRPRASLQVDGGAEEAAPFRPVVSENVVFPG